MLFGMMPSKKQKFPGFDACMAMMRKHDAQIKEDGFSLLLPHAGEYLPQLINVFQSEADHGLRCWLLELIGEARSIEALPLLQEQVRGNDESLRIWAIYGLKQLGTKEARKTLWEARAYTFASPEETAYFQGELKRILDD